MILIWIDVYTKETLMSYYSLSNNNIKLELNEIEKAQWLERNEEQKPNVMPFNFIILVCFVEFFIFTFTICSLFSVPVIFLLHIEMRIKVPFFSLPCHCHWKCFRIFYCFVCYSDPSQFGSKSVHIHQRMRSHSIFDLISSNRNEQLLKTKLSTTHNTYALSVDSWVSDTFTFQRNKKMKVSIISLFASRTSIYSSYNCLHRIFDMNRKWKKSKKKIHFLLIFFVFYCNEQWRKTKEQPSTFILIFFFPHLFIWHPINFSTFGQVKFIINKVRQTTYDCVNRMNVIQEWVYAQSISYSTSAQHNQIDVNNFFILLCRHLLNSLRY